MRTDVTAPNTSVPPARSDGTVRICLLLPDLLGTYGDRGNAIVLAQRLRWRGCRAEIVEVRSGDSVPVGCELYVLGGGEDVAQLEATRLLDRSGFPAAVRRGAVVLAVCAGVQILGTGGYDPSGRHHPGLGLLDLVTRPRRRRATGEVVAHPLPETGLSQHPLTGFENHLGGTELGSGTRPLARMASGIGNGDGYEGVFTPRIVGTYLHGPVLARNPVLADHLLAQATGMALEPLVLDDVDELRRTALSRARTRRPALHRVRAALTPRRWRTPGIPARRG